MEESSAKNPWSDVLEGLVRSVRSTVDLQRQMLGGGTNPADLGSAYVRFLRNELLPYGRTVAELTVDYYRALVTAARDYGQAFSDEVLSSREGYAGDLEANRAKTERPALTLTGEVGSHPEVRFTLENHDPDPAKVTLELGICRGPGGEAFPAPLLVEPASLTIDPGETAIISVAVDLTEGSFLPGVAYRMPLYVVGPRPATVDVTIVATVPAIEEPTEAAPSGYVVECPKCRRQFERTTDDLRLRPHKNPNGDDCPGRNGRRPKG